MTNTLAFLIALLPADAPQPQYHELVQADEPVAYWRFEGPAEETAGRSSGTAKLPPATVSGRARLGIEGPRPSDYPLFDEGNRAADLTEGAFFRVKDPGETSPLDFTNGDAMTLEAWVSVRKLRGTYQYLIGKGRTGNKGFPADNQNYALRLAKSGSGAGITFLFRSAGEKSDWHRWTSKNAIGTGDGWHHVALTYVFGKPESLRGYVDGERVKGTWDYGGKTERAPVVDDDELWIGSALGGKPDSSLDGQIDEVAIYRKVLSKERIAARYRFVSELPEIKLAEVTPDKVRVDIFEGLTDKASWDFRPPRYVESYEIPGFAFFGVPQKYSEKGLRIDRSNPFLIRAYGKVRLPEGKHRLLVRCRNASRLSLDGKKIAETDFHRISGSAHGTVFPVDLSLAPNIRPLYRGDTEDVVEIVGDGKEHVVLFEMIVGGRGHRPDFGETAVCIATPEGDFSLLSNTLEVPLTDAAWPKFMAEQRAMYRAMNRKNRRIASAEEDKYWGERHRRIREAVLASDGPAPPEVGEGLPVHNAIDRFIGRKLEEAGVEPAPLTGDLAFLRRVTLDTTGRIPTPAEIEAFLADKPSERRSRAIDRLLDAPGWADHWVAYWQDVLAENPNMIKPTLNNSGPFRWWIFESFEDNKPIDRFVTELITMEGSQRYGGPAGFAVATQNDVPMAAKAHIIGQAFLGVNMKCARCHDAPFHDLKQQDLFAMAAMLNRGPQKVPATSSIPGGAEVAESLLVEVSLKPGSNVAPEWTFEELVQKQVDAGLVREPDDTRGQLAALVTSPNNTRFARVIVNRLWHRYLGRGLVEPVDDWEHADPTHPELLDYLARELVLSGYDLKHVARLILNSHAYQRLAREPADAEEAGLFAAPAVRRLSAEQMVDSLFLACGKDFDAGRMCIDIDGAMRETAAMDLGTPRRAWMFASTANERDRPSLALPFAQPFVTLMQTFGWRSSRQDPLTVREQEPTPRQPAILANGILGRRFTRLSDDSAWTDLALEDVTVDELVDRVYLRFLTRKPTETERKLFVELLSPGFEERVLDPAPQPPTRTRLPRNMVSWSNHLNPEANTIKTQLEAAVQEGDPPTMKLEDDWRERMEDALWALLNSPEFVFVP